jgi:hypothetical protein
MIWIGPGVLLHTPTKEDPRTEIAPGEALPADLPEDMVARLMKSGKASKQGVQAAPIVPDLPERLHAALAECDDLRQKLEEIGGAAAEIDALREQVAERDATIAEMHTAAVDGTALIDQLCGELAERDATIAALTEQLTAPAGPKGGKK